jgi:hypothetical protein
LRRKEVQVGEAGDWRNRCLEGAQNLNRPITKSSLSKPLRQLIELQQNICFGRITNLKVRDGEPVFDPPPKVVRSRKMGSQDNRREELNLEDFWLKQPVVDLIETIREVGDGEILSITVLHGLPHVVETSHGVSA